MIVETLILAAIAGEAVVPVEEDQLPDAKPDHGADVGRNDQCGGWEPKLNGASGLICSAAPSSLS